MAKEYPGLKADGIGLVAISVDPRAESVKMAEKLGIGFALLEDPGAEVAERYGVKMARDTLAVPSTFVLRQDATVAWSHLGESSPDRPALDVVRDYARAAK